MTWILVILSYCCVCLASAKIQVHIVSTSNATRFTNDSFYPAAVLKAHNKLVYLSYPRVNNDTSIKLVWHNNQQCEIILPRIAYLSTQAQSLANGKIIVALVENSLTSSQANAVGVRFYAIDYQDQCNYRQFVVQLAGTILYSYKTFDLIGYHDSFDVFAKSSRHCQPRNSLCMIRYSDEGVHLGTRNFDFDTSDRNIDLESVHPLQEYDSTNGYVYTSNQRSIIYILDASLITIRVAKISGHMISHSVLNGEIGICVNTYEAGDSVECLKVDSRMKIKWRVSLNDQNYFGTRRLYNLLDGSSLVVSLSRGRVSGLVRRLDVDGKISSSASLFQYDCQTRDSQTKDYFAELKAAVYCFSYACRNGLITHCTNLPTDDRLPLYLT